MSERLQLRGELVGHDDWVTSVAMTSVKEDCLVSSSRDKTCLVWAIMRSPDGEYGMPYKALKGHSHFVSEVRGKVHIPVTSPFAFNSST